MSGTFLKPVILLSDNDDDDKDKCVSHATDREGRTSKSEDVQTEQRELSTCSIDNTQMKMSGTFLEPVILLSDNDDDDNDKCVSHATDREGRTSKSEDVQTEQRELSSTSSNTNCKKRNRSSILSILSANSIDAVNKHVKNKRQGAHGKDLRAKRRKRSRRFFSDSASKNENLGGDDSTSKVISSGDSVQLSNDLHSSSARNIVKNEEHKAGSDVNDLRDVNSAVRADSKDIRTTVSPRLSSSSYKTVIKCEDENDVKINIKDQLFTRTISSRIDNDEHHDALDNLNNTPNWKKEKMEDTVICKPPDIGQKSPRVLEKVSTRTISSRIDNDEHHDALDNLNNTPNWKKEKMEDTVICKPPDVGQKSPRVLEKVSTRTISSRIDNDEHHDAIDNLNNTPNWKKEKIEDIVICKPPDVGQKSPRLLEKVSKGQRVAYDFGKDIYFGEVEECNMGSNIPISDRRWKVQFDDGERYELGSDEMLGAINLYNQQKRKEFDNPHREKDIEQFIHNFNSKRNEVLQSVPSDVMYKLRKPGLALWNGGNGGKKLPAFFVGPYDVSPGHVRETWFREYKKHVSSSSKKNTEYPIIVFWYGQKKLASSFSIAPNNECSLIRADEYTRPRRVSNKCIKGYNEAEAWTMLQNALKTDETTQWNLPFKKLTEFHEEIFGHGGKRLLVEINAEIRQRENKKKKG